MSGSPSRAPDRAAEPIEDLGARVSVVHRYIAPPPARHLPHMLIATTLVAVLPLGVSLALRASGAISAWLSVALAVATSMAASTAGSAYWRKRGGHGEVLFGELLLWGWIRSWRQERELANTTRLLDLVNPDATPAGAPDELTVERRQHLLKQLAGALEGQDVYLNGHSRRVARHAAMIARGMGLSSEQVARVRAAAAVHDVGKLRTPKAVLNKPGPLTDAEFDVIQLHPADGADMVAALGDPELTRIVRHHHERLDGGGYPDQLRGDEIPLGARIIAVADTFDAITSARPYRDAAPHQRAIDILRQEAGSQLDPDAVRAFLAYYSGNRPTVVWAVVSSSVRRVVSWLTGDPAAAATISVGKVATATVATAAIAAVAGAAPVPVPVPVVHQAPRPGLAHRVAARPIAAGAGLQRRGVSVIVPARTRTRAPAKAPARTKRTAMPGTPAKSPTSATPIRSRHAAEHRAMTKPGQVQRTGPSHPAVSGSGSATAGPSPAPSITTSRPVPASPAKPTPATHSHGSGANGNAYGHTKPLGNGHGKGVAAGHGNASVVSPVTAPSNPTIPSQSEGNSSNGNSQHNDQPNGQDNGNSQGKGNSQGNAKTSSGEAESAPGQLKQR